MPGDSGDTALGGQAEGTAAHMPGSCIPAFVFWLSHSEHPSVRGRRHVASDTGHSGPLWQRPETWQLGVLCLKALWPGRQYSTAVNYTGSGVRTPRLQFRLQRL